jgi:hypothetical protein
MSGGIEPVKTKTKQRKRGAAELAPRRLFGEIVEIQTY